MSLTTTEMKKFKQTYTVNENISVLETESMKRFVPAPCLRAAFNVGSLFDVPNSRVVIGSRGEHILMGGFAHVNSVCAGGNAGKTQQMLELFGAVLGKYVSARGIYYDTENTLGYDRIERALHKYPHTEFYDSSIDVMLPADERKVTMVQAADMNGEDFVETIRDLSRERVKNKRSARPKNMVTLPVMAPNKVLMQMMAPLLPIIDSLSMFTTASVMEKTLGDNKIGDSKNATLFMKDGLSKTQFIYQVPGITATGDIYMGMVAHVGTQIQIDPYAPKPLKLTFQKAGTALKGVPEKFGFINNHVYETWSVGRCVHPTTKAPFWPLTEADKNSGNDLIQLNIFNTRNKSGPVGVEFNLIFSQKEGIDLDLSCLNLIKSFGKPGYGMDGNDQNYFSVFLPDVKLSRTTARRKLQEDYMLKRAVELTAQYLQVQLLWDIPDEARMEPEDVYKKIVELGYDWEMLLNTRGNWVYLEDEMFEDKPIFTVADMIEMALGKYHPFWLKDIPEKHPNREALMVTHKENLKVHKEYMKAYHAPAYYTE